MLDLDETLVHSSLKKIDGADYQFTVNVPDVGPKIVYVKVFSTSKYLIF